MRRLAIGIALVAAALAHAQTSPKQQFGHDLGDDYFLANYQQLGEYWKKLDKESDRFTLVEIGKTEEGRPQFMAVVTDPANQRQLNKYKGVAEKLARGRITEEEAKKLAHDGKAVVWIDGGLHASEVLCAQALMEIGWRLVSKNDAETKRILKDCIVLLVHANPDGMDLCADWYMRKPSPQERSLGGLPRLYQKYIGHDNNRDFFSSSQSETENMNRVMYREWYPQIVYNHHQSGPAGTVMFAPPFRDPFAYEVDPLVRSGLDLVSSAMMNRFLAEDKPGVTVRSGSAYSGWWNGGLRTMAYFHNMVGILTETIGSPTPSRIPFVAQRQVPNMDQIRPIEPQEWHLRQSIEYSITADYAILDYASKYRENLLLNIWQMGRNSIERGQRDNWTPNPRKIQAARGVEELRRPEDRDPRAYIIPASQPDYATATKFVNALIETGVEVQRADKEFAFGGKMYPAGSYVVRCDQAFRPHVLSMFEPQVHPDDIPYPGAPPTPPYDNAGWTLAYSMGVQFDRVMEKFDVSFETLKDAVQPSVPCVLSPDAGGFVIDCRVNDAFTAVNRLQGAGLDVYRIFAEGVDRGNFFVPSSTHARDVLLGLARTHGVRVTDSRRAPANLQPLPKPRIALLDVYGGSMPSGWTRWILEKFEFPFTVVYPPDIDAGILSDYDSLILVDGMGFGGGGGRGGGNLQSDATIPAEWRARMGSLTTETSLPNVREFVENGGTVVAIGSATRIGELLGLPIKSALVETVDGQERALPRAKFYVPGSILRAKLDTTNPLTFGMSADTDVFFDSSPAFSLTGEGEKLAWYETDAPLRSGWAWGQAALKDAVAAAAFDLGKGKVVLYGPEILFRSQPHGCFKLLFNALEVRASGA